MATDGREEKERKRLQHQHNWPAGSLPT